MAGENSKPSYYAIIPAKVRYDPELRPNAKLLYGEITALANSKGYCFMSNSEFAENYGMDKKAVSRLISQLADKGYITVEVIRDPGSKTVTERRIWIDTPPHRQKEDTPSPPNSGEGINQKDDTPHHQKAEENNTSKVFNKPPISPKGDGGRKRARVAAEWKPERFEAFWKYYSKNACGKDKEGARKAWNKLKPDDALISTMARAVQAQVASEEWQRGIGIPHAQTWLNRRRWEDEVEPEPDAEPDTSEKWGWGA